MDVPIFLRQLLNFLFIFGVMELFIIIEIEIWFKIVKLFMVGCNDSFAFL
jgi:hypothetical protein